jgi:BirA family biotin operon repressor/biotin-[acetyl-CoA-carboxylase] ligase
VRSSLEPKIVSAGLVTSGQPWRNVEFHDAIGSTNARLRDLLGGAAESEAGAATPLGTGADALWCVVLTDNQTGGKGRLGRTWEAPDRAAIAVSAAVPVTSPAGAGWLPLIAGLAVSRAIRAVSRDAGHELTPRLKWPNDVLLPDDADRKVCGILCELVTLRSAGGPGPSGYAVVVGTGVNVDQTREELPVETATSLALAGVRVRREALVVGYLRELAAILRADAPGTGTDDPAQADDPARPVAVDTLSATVAAAYRAECSTLGQRVRIHLPTGEAVEGEALTVDDDGSLVVRTPDGTRSFPAGDVEHVRRP